MTSADGIGDAIGVAPRGLARPPRPARRWYRNVAPAVLRIDCGGARHTIRWRKGRLVLLDHDVAAERTMMALGSDRPACLTVLERWRSTLGPPAAGSAAAAIGIAAPTPVARSGRAGTRGRTAGGDLRSFGADLGRIIELSQLVRAERRWSDPDLAANDRTRLVDALVSGLTRATAASLRPSALQRGRQQLAVRVRPVPSGEESAVEIELSAARIALDLQLPLSWVVEVAGAGLDELDDRLVLAVIDREPSLGRVGVLGVLWQVEGPGRVQALLERWWMGHGPDGWTVAHDAPRPVHPSRSLWWSTSRR